MHGRKEFYSPDEVAALLNLHVRTVRRFIREGKLDAVRVGKQYRIAAADLREFTATRSGQPLSPLPATRRSIVSTTVDIDAIGLAETHRVTALLTDAFQSSPNEEHGQSLNCIYYEGQDRLRIVVNAELEFATAVLGLINGVLKTGQGD